MICERHTGQECIRIAHSKRELSAAFSLVYQCYLEAGLIEPNAIQARVLPQHALPSTEVVVARVHDGVYATATIVRDNFLGLPLEAIYAAEVGDLRSQGMSVAEVSCLADRREEISRNLIKDLMAFIAQCAKSAASISS